MGLLSQEGGGTRAATGGGSTTGSNAPGAVGNGRSNSGGNVNSGSVSGGRSTGGSNTGSGQSGGSSGGGTGGMGGNQNDHGGNSADRGGSANAADGTNRNTTASRDSSYGGSGGNQGTGARGPTGPNGEPRSSPAGDLGGGPGAVSRSPAGNGPGQTVRQNTTDSIRRGSTFQPGFPGRSRMTGDQVMAAEQARRTYVAQQEAARLQTVARGLAQRQAGIQPGGQPRPAGQTSRSVNPLGQPVSNFGAKQGRLPAAVRPPNSMLTSGKSNRFGTGSTVVSNYTRKADRLPGPVATVPGRTGNPFNPGGNAAGGNPPSGSPPGSAPPGGGQGRGGNTGHGIGPNAHGNGREPVIRPRPPGTQNRGEGRYALARRAQAQGARGRGKFQLRGRGRHRGRG